MALYYELPVYRDTYRLILLIFTVTKDFSREYQKNYKESPEMGRLKIAKAA